MTKLVCEVCGHLFEAEIEEENLNPDCPKCSSPETNVTTDLSEYETIPEKNTAAGMTPGNVSPRTDKPPLGEEKHQSCTVKFDEAEWRSIQSRAKQANMTVSEYIRRAALSAAII